MLVWDDTGIGCWSTYGGLVETPNMQRLADLGLRFSNWHTTALCSPTRSSLLTGRNAHANGMACIVEGANGFPGLSAVIPPENGTLAEILVEQGWSTFALGKWHLTPETESTMASSRRTWPTGRGFERYYGFLGGETNQWYPDLVSGTEFVEQPYLPDDGYHFSKDLVDKTIRFVRDNHQVDPEKPYFAYLAPGCAHAPHHAPAEWIEKYKGRFDDGYEVYRTVVAERMVAEGLLPEGTEATEMNPWSAEDGTINAVDVVLPWEELSEDQRTLFCRLAEVYAGFISYTDHEIGRFLDALEELGRLDNTIFVVVSDNGASGEGTPNGSVNENKFFNGWPDDLQENLAKLDELGGPGTYEHIPTGWAWAFNTPYKMFKRFTLEGGIADPLIIAWPAKTRGVGGQVRHQYHHAIDIMPTILELCGVEEPAFIKGHPQSEVHGVSMAYCLEDAEAPSTRTTQYYAMLGTRALYHDGWKVVARHGAITGAGNFMDDEWELYHVAEDRAEQRDLAAEEPAKLQELIALWFTEAGRNNAFPLDDRTAREQLALERPTTGPDRDTYVYFPDTAEVPEGVTPNIRNKSFTITAEVDVAEGVEGVIVSQGARFGGYSLFVKDSKAHFAYNFLGIDETLISSPDPLPAGPVEIAVAFEKAGEDPPFVANGTVQLLVGGDIVAKSDLRTQPGKFALAGEGLAVGRDVADPVSSSYSAPFAFQGGQIGRVTIQISADGEHDAELEAQGAVARE